MLPIVTVTLNPALDITTSVGQLKPQQKLRCAVPRTDPGGGGVNVSRVLKELGGTSRAFVAVGGNTGRQLETLLAAAGIDAEFWQIGAETRFSLTVMEDVTALHYRFVLPGPVVTADETEAMLARLSSIMSQSPGYVVASGSLPPGMPDDFYGRLVRRAREAGTKVVVDTHGAPLRAAAAERPYLIRLNHLEAQELLGGDADWAAHQFARELVDRQLTETAIVTLGERGAIVATRDDQVEIRPPLVQVRSSVGAGDSFVAALTFGLASGWPVEEAARYGVAAAAATMTTEATELCHRDTVNAFFAQIGGHLRPAA